MRSSVGFVVATILLAPGLNAASGQQQNRAIPSVKDLIKQLDANEDGFLTQEEISESPYRRQFPRWDANKDGKVTEAEIGEFRRGLGVPIEGTRPGPNQNRRGRQPANDEGAKLTIPEVDDLLRVERGTRVPVAKARNSEYVVKTRTHEVDGDQYVVLTDHLQPEYLAPLKRLAEHRNGVVLSVENLATLHEDPDAVKQLQEELREAKVRYVAVAPRHENFREYMLLGLWELLAGLDEDPQLDAYPGLLIASGADEFEQLIDRSISYVAQSTEQLHPFAISQVPSSQELRSLQKSGILRNMFAELDRDTPTFAIYSPAAEGAPELPGDAFWSHQVRNRRDFVSELPADAAEAFANANLVVMHGHGIPGMSCGVDIDLIPEKGAPAVLLCGSCFSASPQESDFPGMQQAPGGYSVASRQPFVLRAVDQGTTVAFGHMRLSQGFVHLFPVLECWLQGKTVGESYQELINAIIDRQQVRAGGFIPSDDANTQGRPSQGRLLYVIIGDPAVRPYESMIR